MSILDALEEINTEEKQASRVICEDGLLSVSDEVFECVMRELGFDREEIKEWMMEPPELRNKFMRQWNVL